MRPRHERHRHLGVHELIERQTFRWKGDALARGETEIPEEAPRREPAFGPYVSLSRDFGSGALLVAGGLSEKLGWAVYDRELVDEVARDAHVGRELVESLDERTPVWLEEYLTNLGFAHSLSEMKFFRHLARVVTTIGRHGKAILVGRGANFLLKPEYGTRIRLIAPLEFRVKAIVQGHRISEREALTLIARKDEERANFIRHHFGREIGDPAGYDKLFDVSKISHAEIVLQVLGMLETKLAVHVSPARTARVAASVGAGSAVHVEY